MTAHGVAAAQAGVTHGVIAATARKWLGRYLARGQEALTDASSRPAVTPRAVDPAKVLLIVEMSKCCVLQARIVLSVGVSGASVSVVASWRRARSRGPGRSR